MLKPRNVCEDATMLTARSPAKLIISGEHSVLFGQPAIAMAVNRYTNTSATWRDAPDIKFNINDLAYAGTHSIQTLGTIAKQLRTNYLAFLNGQCNIRDVLKRPAELLQYSVASLIDKFAVKLAKGLEITVSSDIPLGCGMGSSAAAVISTLVALSNFLKLNLPADDLLSFGLELENLQHGKSSGLDLYLVTRGGCVRFQQGLSVARPVPRHAMYIINTGKPDASTGECVSKTQRILAANPNLVSDFGCATDEIDRALTVNNFTQLRDAVRVNHRLLQKLQVVPARIADFVRDLEHEGAAAKICGAGSIRGENAGIVLLVTERDLTPVINKHGFQAQSIQVDTYGTQII